MSRQPSSVREVDRPQVWALAAGQTAVFVVLLWAIEGLDALLGGRLDQFGIEPRTEEGLLGILFAPLLHYGLSHLVANTLPTVLLLFLVLVSGIRRGLAATAIIWLVGGAGVWLTAASDTTTVGASILIFGWLVYLIVRGAFTRSVGEIILGIVLFLLYGTVLLGVLPGQPGISWQGHLFGAIGGALAAWLLSDRVDRAGSTERW